MTLDEFLYPQQVSILMTSYDMVTKDFFKALIIVYKWT